MTHGPSVMIIASMTSLLVTSACSASDSMEMGSASAVNMAMMVVFGAPEVRRVFISDDSVACLFEVNIISTEA